MSQLKHLLDKNSDWVKQINQQFPGSFEELAKGQSPEFLWIGCSDSRIPTLSLVGLAPGDIFVHRNIANQVAPNENSVQSAIEYAVNGLGVRHIVICGHYGCGGVKKAMDMKNAPDSALETWVQPIKAVYDEHAADLEDMEPDTAYERLCELNVIQQVKNTCELAVIQHAWQNKAELSVHGLIYDLGSGLLHDLNISHSAPLTE